MSPLTTLTNYLNTAPKTPYDTPTIHKSKSAFNRPINTPAGKAALPMEFSIVTANDGDAVSNAAESPDTISTTVAIHARSSRGAAEAVGMALTEVLYERAVYPQNIFRCVSKYGLPIHKLGSAFSSSEDDLAALFSDAIKQVATAEELASSKPSAVVVDILNGTDVTERWTFTLDIDAEDEKSGRSTPSEELHIEMGILLKQVHRSCLFLPPLEEGVQHALRISAVDGPKSVTRRPASPPRFLATNDEAEETADDADDEDDEEDEQDALDSQRAIVKGSPVTENKSKGAEGAEEATSRVLDFFGIEVAGWKENKAVVAAVAVGGAAALLAVYAVMRRR